jgi:hypothetical protein
MHEDTVGGALGRPRSVNWWSVSPANERYGMDHHTRESIEAHLTIVFAALAVSHYIERQTDWGIKKFVKTTPPLPHCEDQSRAPDPGSA